ncbi:phophatidylserine decarboxylase associated domain-containing protein [Xanthomonas vasicola pv. musacearum]|nr:phophatidylserine decarboxylase associated domain-containing protein [Xanthomonas vasicola pv. musacearum NCPPB 2251]MBV7291680.1 phophatidylserine decarboxylase associated domain-containing protein [Xanthomonas vasicola pv. musacearum]
MAERAGARGRRRHAESLSAAVASGHRGFQGTDRRRCADLHAVPSDVRAGTAQTALQPVSNRQAAGPRLSPDAEIVRRHHDACAGVQSDRPCGFPDQCNLDWPMGTGSGASAVLNEKVNAAFRAMLNEWARFLASPDSTYVLNSDPVSGWFGRAAKTAMPYFATNLICEPTAPHYEFTSWDDFFTRRFRPGVCPFDAPDDDAVIVNACESAPYRLAHGVQLRDRFWLQAQPYSLDHMLAHDAYVEQFVGGSVYQAFFGCTQLSPLA